MYIVHDLTLWSYLKVLMLIKTSIIIWGCNQKRSQLGHIVNTVISRQLDVINVLLPRIIVLCMLLIMIGSGGIGKGGGGGSHFPQYFFRCLLKHLTLKVFKILKDARAKPHPLHIIRAFGARDLFRDYAPTPLQILNSTLARVCPI